MEGSTSGNLAAETASNKLYWKLCGVLVGLWLGGIALLLALQYLGTGFGFQVWPLGEDRVWLWITQNSSGKHLPALFWSINDRNPLLPYWYYAAKPVILGFPDFGWYLVRRPVDLMCALSVFTLLYRIGRGRFSFFAFSCALLTLLWNFNGYRSMVIWVMVADLSVSALCLWSYLKYVDGNRSQGHYLAISLMLYLVAIGTYTLQSSILLPIFAFGLLRPPTPSGRSRWRDQVRPALLDAGLFLAMFVLFYLVWMTTRRPVMDVYYKLKPSLIIAQLGTSLTQAIWHSSYTSFLGTLFNGWSRGVLIGAGLASAVCFGTLFACIRRLTAPQTTAAEQTCGDSPATEEPSIYPTLGYTLLVAFALYASTLVVESTSDVWYAGSRTLMIQQVFQPLAYCALFFGAVGVLNRWSRRWTYRVQWVGMTAACVVAYLVGLEYNHQLNAHTRYDKQFFSALDKAAPQGFEGQQTIIMKLDGGVDLARWGTCTHRYVQTYYKNPKLNLQFLIPGAPVEGFAGYNTMVFLPDDQGVQMMGPNEGLDLVPYHQLRFAVYDGQKVTFQEAISAEELRGFRVKYDRPNSIRCSMPPVIAQGESQGTQR